MEISVLGRPRTLAVVGAFAIVIGAVSGSLGVVVFLGAFVLAGVLAN